MKKYMIIVILLSLLGLAFVSANIGILGANNSSIIRLAPSSVQSAISFLDLTDTPDSYAGQAENCVVVDPEENGLTFALCGGGAGDITAVLGDAYITNGSNTGDVRLSFNQTLNNLTINSLIDADEFHYNQTTPAQSYTDAQLLKYLNLSGTNANQNINVSPYNITTNVIMPMISVCFNPPSCNSSINVTGRYWADGRYIINNGSALVLQG